MPYVPPHLRSGGGGPGGGGGRSGGGGGGSGGGGSHFRGDHPPRGGGGSSSSPGDYGGAFGDNRSRGGPGGGGRDFSPSYGGGDPRYDNSRGGGGRGGGYDNDRRGGGYGGGGDRRGNYDNDRRGGYDDRRGGYGGGGYDDRRGGYGGGGGRSPYDDRRGSGGGDPRYGGGAGRPPSARFGSPSPMVGDAQPPSPAPPPAPSDTSAGSSPTQQHGAPTSGLFVEWSPTERVKNLTDEQTNEIRKRLNVTVDQKTSDSSKSVDTLARIAPPVEAFEDMALHPNIVADIRYHDYERPTPIQAQAMPVALSNRDILGCAQTGSGKTAAYSIPMIQHCIHLREAAKRSGARLERGPAGLVLAPTRELAQQIEQECRAFTRSSTGLVRTCIVVGGANMGEQRGELRSGVDIVVATPGRFVDHLQQGNTNLWRVSFVVLDEADRMLDMGFEPQIRDVMGALKERPVPQDNKVAVQLSKSYQTLLFSATMPPEIEELANVYLTDPVQVKVGAVSTPTANVSQTLQKVPQEEKPPELLQVLMTEYVQLYQNSGGAGTGRFENAPLTIIFVERKARCDDIVDFLNEEFEARQAQMGFELRAVALHGGRAQHEREQALNDFTNKRVPILVATDVASRGLDVSGVALVVNFDLPQSFEDYVHRIGRTGRAGTIGKAVSFYTDRDSFVVVQVKRALAELEAGNVHAFQTGKAARQKEKEDKEAFRAAVANGGAAPRPAADGDAPPMAGSGVQILDEKLKHLALFQNSPNVAGGGSGGGAADDAWDD